MRHDRRVPEFVGRSAHAWHESPPRAYLACLTLLFVCTTTLGCESESPTKIHLNLGPRSEEQRSFVPKSSLAEYTELPGEGSELRILLSSHAISCDLAVPLNPEQTLVALTFRLPYGMKLQPGPYLWTGLDEAESTNVGAPAPTPTLQPATASSAATPASTAPAAIDPPIARVMPYVRLGKQGVELPPGGHVELTEIRLDAQGLVRGLLKIEQAGSVGLPATSLLGSFSARWCRISPLGPNDGR